MHYFTLVLGFVDYNQHIDTQLANCFILYLISILKFLEEEENFEKRNDHIELLTRNIDINLE